MITVYNKNADINAGIFITYHCHLLFNEFEIVS